MRGFTSDRGSSLVEMLISTLIGGIVMVSILDLYVQTSHGTQTSASTTDMQTQVKAGMDFMVKELRLIYGLPTITSTVSAKDTISFTRVEDSGYSSGGNSLTTLSNTSKAWKTNRFASSVSGSYMVSIQVGKSVGEVHPIVSNTATALTLSDTWSTIPDTSSLFLISRTKTFSRTTDNMLRYQIGTGPPNVIATNITSLSFTQTDPWSLVITVTGRTANPDPNTGAYRYFTLTDTARKRN
jgi:Tfp pilus assembly protein PilW